jgi:hypothetical protein
LADGAHDGGVHLLLNRKNHGAIAKRLHAAGVAGIAVSS